MLTTVLNYAVFWLFQQAWQGRHVLFANLLTCLIATAFAYVTNKVFVFHSPAWHPGFVLREALAFLSGRLFSFGIEEAGLYVAAYVLDGTMLSKIVVSFLAVLVFWSAFLSTSSPEAFF